MSILAFLSSMLITVTDHSHCGVRCTDPEQAIFRERESSGVYQRFAPPLLGVQTIYVQAHVIQYSNGSDLGGITDQQVELCIETYLNQGFDGYGFSFELLPDIKRIFNSDWVDLESPGDVSELIAEYPQTRWAVNVYFTPEPPISGGQSTAGYASYSTSPIRLVAIHNAFAIAGVQIPGGSDGPGSQVEVITHEFGHYFDLRHTHEIEEWGQECVDGTQCGATGDRCCDTPADPNLGQTPMIYPMCTVSPHPSWPEPCGVGDWQPDPTNFMSYAGMTGDSRCVDSFTPNQQQRMYNSLVSFQRELTDLEVAGCCFTDGSCQPLGRVSCGLSGGVYQGSDTPCQPELCSRGPCCLDNGFCFPQVSQDACDSQGGLFIGPGNICPPLPCDSSDPGTCCFLNGDCNANLPLDCAASGGSWIGFGQDCSDVPCEGLDIACCFPTQCLEITAESCLASGGSLEAIGGCSDSVCDPKACCLTGGVCVDLLRSICVASGGSSESDAACDATQCQAPSCPGDVDGDGQVAFGDLLATLSVWGPCVDCPEDFDGDDAVTFDDLIGLLSVWGDC